MRTFLRIAFVAVICLTSALYAAPITVRYLGAYVQGPDSVTTPTLLTTVTNPAVNNVRFKFFVPDYQRLVWLNSLAVGAEVYDDDAGQDELNGSERGTLTFVLNQVTPSGPLVNPMLADFSPDGYTAGNPLAVGGSLCDCELDLALVEILIDGTFFVRVNRRGGVTPSDFYVNGPPTVLMDGVIVPEPGSAALALAGFALAALARRRLGAGRHRQ